MTEIATVPPTTAAPGLQLAPHEPTTEEKSAASWKPWVAEVRVFDPEGREIAYGAQTFGIRPDGAVAIDAAVEECIEALYRAREQAKLGLSNTSKEDA